MATRLYFRNQAITGVNPATAFDAAWENTTSALRRAMEKGSARGTDPTGTDTLSSTSGQDRLHRQYIGPPMAAGNVFDTSVTYKCYIQVFESAANDNCVSRLGLRIVDIQGVVQHTVLAVADYSTGSEWNPTTARSKAFADGDAGSGSYTTKDGDRLVLEIGHSDAAGTTISGSSKWSFAVGATGDLPENETDTSTTLVPWFETSLNIVFLQPEVFALTSGTEVNPGATSVSASITPTTDRDVFVVVTAYQASADFSIDSVSGCGLTWVRRYHSSDLRSDANSAHMAVFVGRGTPSTGTLTITYSTVIVSGAASWSVVEVANVSDYVQDKPASGSSTVASVTLDPATGDDSIVLLLVGESKAVTGPTVTPEDGYAELHDVNLADAGTHTVWLSHDNAAGNRDHGVTLSATSEWAALAVEIVSKVSKRATPRAVKAQAVHRASRW